MIDYVKKTKIRNMKGHIEYLFLRRNAYFCKRNLNIAYEKISISAIRFVGCHQLQREQEGGAQGSYQSGNSGGVA